MQRNEELHATLSPPVDRWIVAFNTHDVASIVSLYVEDAELLDSGMPRSRQGRQEIERWFRWRFRSTPITYIPTGQSITETGQVIITWTAHGRGPRLLARSFQVDGQSCFILQDGLIQKQQGTYDHVAVLRQIAPPLQWLPAAVARFIYQVYLWRSGPIMD